MNDTKGPESAYSGERTKITGPSSLRSTTQTVEPSTSEQNAPTAEPANPVEKTASPETQRTGASLPEVPKTRGSFPPSFASAGTGAMGDFVEFLKGTKRVWLTAAAAIFGLMLVVTVAKRFSEQAKTARAARQEHQVATVTADSLLARCGQPTEDVTKEMYPIIVRTISYQSKENQKIVFEFSRTAEEKSDWVFLSMKDANGARSYDTPQAKIAAMPCLELKK